MASCNLANYFTSFFSQVLHVTLGDVSVVILTLIPIRYGQLTGSTPPRSKGKRTWLVTAHSSDSSKGLEKGNIRSIVLKDARNTSIQNQKKKCKYNNTPRVTVVDSDQLRSSWPASTLRCSCQNLKINKLKEQAEGARWLQTQTALPCSNRLGPLRQPRLGQLVLASWSCHARLAILVLRGVQAERPCPRHWPETESCTCRPAADPSQTIRLVRPILVSLVLGLKFSLGTKF